MALDAAEPSEAAQLALSDIPIPLEHAPPSPAEDADSPPAAEMDNGPPDGESVAERRERARQRPSRWRLPIPVAIAALLLLSAGLIGLRKDVVRHAPQLASFYSAIGMPVVHDLPGVGRNLDCVDLHHGHAVQATELALGILGGIMSACI